MAKIDQIIGSEIKDSRGEPTLQVELRTDDGIVVESSIPSGRSLSTHEVMAFSPFDAIASIDAILSSKLKGCDVNDQKGIDTLMIELDGTANKSNLGGNAILGISISTLKAASSEKKIPLYKHIAELSGRIRPSMPTPIFNVINGGRHADNDLTFQEFSIVPIGFGSFSEKLEASIKVYEVLGEILKSDGLEIVQGDEGGYAPKGINNDKALEYLSQGVRQAGYDLGKDFQIALDVAASSVKGFNETLESYNKLIEQYPIILIEDPFEEDNWHDWAEFYLKLKDANKNTIVVGDDIFATNASRLRQGIKANAGNGVIIKPNQCGTISELLDVVNVANDNDFQTVVSHRSGETLDSFIADLAVGIGAEFIKSGAPNQQAPERMNKYLRLVEIEKEISNISNS